MSRSKPHAVTDALEALSPYFDGERGDWENVLERARALPERRFRAAQRHRLFALATALVVLAAVAASALGLGLRGGFPAWLHGDPGRPAPPAAQRAFERENAQSYARFPRGTQLRLLLRQRVNGRTFTLLGFRDRRSLCLRVARADRPNGRNVTACTTADQLHTPALVLGSAWFYAGRSTFASGIFGFAADGVRGIEVVRERSGRRSALLASNAFLLLRAQRAGTVSHPPPPDAVLDVYAQPASGRPLPVPFVSDYGLYPKRSRSRPAYVTPGSFPKPAELPGPAKVTAGPSSARIDWIERREPRGAPFAPRGLRLARERVSRFPFARLLQPDPNDPYRLGISLRRVHFGRDDSLRDRRGTTQTILCLHDLPALSRGGSSSCIQYPQGFHRYGPLVQTGLLIGPGLQETVVSGLASDAVASLVFYPQSGAKKGVPLHDNAYALHVRETELPGKLVAFDARGRPIKVEVVSGPSRVEPCPRAEPPRRPPRPPRRIQRLDLGRRSLAGATILGKTPRQVAAALGHPSRRHGGHDGLTLYFGRLIGFHSHLYVNFRLRQGRLVAVSVSLDDPDLRERRLGRILRLQPDALERLIAAHYGSELRLAQPYGSIPGFDCRATFDIRGTHRHLTIGLDPFRKRSFLSLWQG